MSQDLSEFRARVGTLKRTRGRGTGGGLYPILGKEALAAVERLRAAGQDWAQIEASLGLSKTTLTSWKRKARLRGELPEVVSSATRSHGRRRRDKGLVPVEVMKVERCTETTAPSASSRALTLTTPSGFKVEGLTAREALSLMEGLGCC